MISVLGHTNSQASWVCKWNNLRKARPGVYAIDARSELTMVGQDDYYDSDADDGDTAYDREETQRDEREVNIKRERIMNR